MGLFSDGMLLGGITLNLIMSLVSDSMLLGRCIYISF